jgi:hypothetical protein
LAFPAFLDTCVLYPQYLLDTVLTQDDAEPFRPLWSPDLVPAARDHQAPFTTWHRVTCRYLPAMERIFGGR